MELLAFVKMPLSRQRGILPLFDAHMFKSSMDAPPVKKVLDVRFLFA